jgi:hypothetical protein
VATFSATVELFRTLDALYPMPISRTRDRICEWIYRAQQRGLLTPAEAETLRNADAADRHMDAALR